MSSFCESNQLYPKLGLWIVILMIRISLQILLFIRYYKAISNWLLCSYDRKIYCNIIHLIVISGLMQMLYCYIQSYKAMYFPDPSHLPDKLYHLTRGLVTALCVVLIHHTSLTSCITRIPVTAENYAVIFIWICDHERGLNYKSLVFSLIKSCILETYTEYCYKMSGLSLKSLLFH